MGSSLKGLGRTSSRSRGALSNNVTTLFAAVEDFLTAAASNMTKLLAGKTMDMQCITSVGCILG